MKMVVRHVTISPAAVCTRTSATYRYIDLRKRVLLLNAGMNLLLIHLLGHTNHLHDHEAASAG